MASQQARAPLHVALGEFLFLTQFAEPITNYHRGIHIDG
jgi:hypothetical protein